MNWKMRKDASTQRTDRRWVAVTLLLVAGFINSLWTYAYDTSMDRKKHKLGTLLRSSKSPKTILPAMMAQVGADLGRDFPVHHNMTWCTNEGYNKKRGKSEEYYWAEPPTGLLYVKVPKAASSTTASVMHRISRNHGGCDFQAQHTSPAGHFYGNRDKSSSFLLGSVRDPASRAISRVFFYQVSRQKKPPTDSNILRWLNTTNGQVGSVSEGQGGFQLKYMAFDRIEPRSAWNAEAPLEVINAEQVHVNVKKIIEEYDFLLVVERMDESLVVLQMLLEVDIGDMLTLDSKVQGMYTYGNLAATGKDFGCFENVKASASPVVKEYLTSDSWYAQNYGDYVLHAAANASLDRTIDVLGRKRVEAAVTEFRRLKALANDMCSKRAHYPCSKNGTVQVEKSKESCYEKDFGCGYQCIDEMLQSEASENQQAMMSLHKP